MVVLWGCVGIVGIFIGFLCFRTYINPFSLYSALWSLCICAYEWNLIQYERITGLAWAYIVIAWFSLYLGGATVVVLVRGSRSARPCFQCDLARLRKAIIWLSSLGALGLLDQIRVVTQAFGNPFIAVFANAGDIYLGRVGGELAWIPYVGAVLYAACCLAGSYTARTGKATIIGTLPMLLLALSNVFAMVRAGVVMAVFLFGVSYYYTPRPNHFQFKRWQRMFALSSAVAIVLAGFTFVSATRKLGVQFAGMTPEINHISEYIPVFPSIYANFSAPPVALSMYLSSPQERREGSWGQYTFQPIFHILGRLGLYRSAEGEARFEENYYTPVPMNTATYLKNVDSDFGIAGVLLFPFILGVILALLLERLRSSARILHVVVLANLYLVVAFSFVANLMALGDWYICAFASIAAAGLVERRFQGNAQFAHSVVGHTT